MLVLSLHPSHPLRWIDSNPPFGEMEIILSGKFLSSHRTRHTRSAEMILFLPSGKCLSSLRGNWDYSFGKMHVLSLHPLHPLQRGVCNPPFGKTGMILSGKCLSSRRTRHTHSAGLILILPLGKCLSSRRNRHTHSDGLIITLHSGKRFSFLWENGDYSFGEMLVLSLHPSHPLRRNDSIPPFEEMPVLSPHLLHSLRRIGYNPPFGEILVLPSVEWRLFFRKNSDAPGVPVTLAPLN